jgi:hypothetical protein
MDLNEISKFFAERRLSRRQAMRQGAGAVAVGTLATTAFAHASTAQDATPDASPVAGNAAKPASFLFVQTFGAGSISSGGNGNLSLTADHLAGQTVYFSDRPERIAGMLATEKFLGTAKTPISTAMAPLPRQRWAGSGFRRSIRRTRPSSSPALRASMSRATCWWLN